MSKQVKLTDLTESHKLRNALVVKVERRKVTESEAYSQYDRLSKNSTRKK